MNNLQQVFQTFVITLCLSSTLGLGYIQPLFSRELCSIQVDIVFLIDSSESVKNEWDIIINHAERLQSYFTVADDAVRIGIVDFSQVSNVYKHLDANNTHIDIVNIFELLRQNHQNGRSSVERGIGWALELFKNAIGRNSAISRKMLIYTDGDFSKEQNDYLKEFITRLDTSEVTLDFMLVKPEKLNPTLEYLLNHKFIKVFEIVSSFQAGQFYLDQEMMAMNYLRMQNIEVTDEKDAALFAHNKLRKLHGVQETTWDDVLANQSRQWAVHLATVNRMQHSGMENYGENIYYYRGAKSHVVDAIQKWYSTITKYNYNEPKWTFAAGTFTQLIWDTSVNIGMSVAYNPKTRVTYIVAQYKERGNSYRGEAFKDHVQKPLNGLPAYVPDIEELTPPNEQINFISFNNLEIDSDIEKQTMETIAKDLCNNDIVGFSGTPLS